MRSCLSLYGIGLSVFHVSAVRLAVNTTHDLSLHSDDDVPYCLVTDEATCKKMVGKDECIFPSVSKEECNVEQENPFDILFQCHHWGTCGCAPAKPATGECSKAPNGLPTRRITKNGKSWCCDVDPKQLLPKQEAPYCLVASSVMAQGMTGQSEYVLPTKSLDSCLYETTDKEPFKWLLQGCHRWGACNCKPAVERIGNMQCSVAPPSHPERGFWVAGKHWCCEAPTERPAPVPEPMCLVLNPKHCKRMTGSNECQLPQLNEAQCKDSMVQTSMAHEKDYGKSECVKAVKKNHKTDCIKTLPSVFFKDAVSWPIDSEYCCEQKKSGWFSDWR